mgnify:CR=1 FL=1|jgi:hypothetical protein
MILVHAFGAVGMACLLIAYYLVSTGRLSPQTVLYQGLNLVAGIILAVYAAILGAWVSMALNIFWAAIALRALITILQGTGRPAA